MKLRIKSQDDILDPLVRKRIIDEIEGPEERARKREAYRRSKILKDRTDLFVVQHLEKRFSQSTVEEMKFAVANISIMKKIIDKLARVYSDGVKRSVVGSEDGEINDGMTKIVQKIVKKMKLNKALKSTNRITKAQKNAALYLKPCQFFDNQGEERWRVQPTPLHPHLYSVIEENNDRTRPLIYVLSNFDADLGDEARFTDDGTPGTLDGSQVPAQGDGRDQIIADKKEDEGEDEGAKKQYIWWTDKYHFTTLGPEIMVDGSPRVEQYPTPDDEDIQNPIEEKPFIDYAEDRDNSFWAEGGHDLPDGSILINTLLTNAHAIAVDQGYGQLVVTGRKIPQTIPLGPTRAITLEHTDEDGAPPKAEYINSDAPLEELGDQAMSYVALLLTTNNLSVNAVAGSLEVSGDAISGIAKLIDMSESKEDVSDQREDFAESEPDIFRIISKWIEHYGEDIADEQKGLILPETFEMVTEFMEPKVVMSEKEKLEVIEKRKGLNLNTQTELMQIDQPRLTDKQAKEKLEIILKEKNELMERKITERRRMIESGDGEVDDGENQGDENEGDE